MLKEPSLRTPAFPYQFRADHSNQHAAPTSFPSPRKSKEPFWHEVGVVPRRVPVSFRLTEG